MTTSPLEPDPDIVPSGDPGPFSPAEPEDPAEPPATEPEPVP